MCVHTRAHVRICVRACARACVCNACVRVGMCVCMCRHLFPTEEPQRQLTSCGVDIDPGLMFFFAGWGGS